MTTVKIKQPEIITQSIERAIKTLTATGCRFVVITPDGTRHEFGSIEVGGKAHAPRLPPGTYASIYKPLIDDVPVGGVVTVPGGANPEGMRAAAASYASDKWGKGNHTSCIVNGDVQFLREG